MIVYIGAMLDLDYIAFLFIFIIIISYNILSNILCCACVDLLLRNYSESIVTPVDVDSMNTKPVCFQQLNQIRVSPGKEDGRAGAQVPLAPEFQRS